MRHIWYLGVMGLAIGCGGGGDTDSDGDGLTDEEEAQLGLDPDNPDSDGDGLTDGEEIAWGSDPLKSDTDEDGLSDSEEKEAGSDPNEIDSDGDTYTDFDEVQEGHDPADEDDRIYEGYWPYFAGKDEMNDPGWSGALSVGDTFPMHKAKDQFGDRVNLYDFAGPDSPEYIILDIFAEWCGPCMGTSEWLSTGEDIMGHETPYGAVRKAINKGDITWISIMGEDNSGAAPGPEAMANWDSSYPNEMIPVMGDNDGDVIAGVINVTGFWPSAVFVKSSTMKIKELGGIGDVLSQAVGTL
jgi:hypothetical protein